MATASDSPHIALSVRRRVADAKPLVAGLTGEISSLTDAELVAAVEEIEALVRQVDALKVRVAGEVDVRSDPLEGHRVGDDRLAIAFGCRGATELLERTTRASVPELRSRVRLDRRTRDRHHLMTGETTTRYPVVAEAFREGAIGIDIARHLTDELELASRTHHIDPDEKRTAEREIISATVAGLAGAESTSECDDALPTTFDEYRTLAQVWIEFLTRDGVEPDDDSQTRRRGFSLGRAKNGLVPVRGDLAPEVAAGIQRLFDAYAGSRTLFAPGTPEPGTDENTPWNGDEKYDDPRSPAQRNHDVLGSIVQAAARSADAPSLGGSAPTLVVTTTISDLDGGIVDVDGVDVAAPAHLAHRIVCTGAVQKMVFDRNGRIVRIGTRERLFNTHQRRAIATRDGGCVIPGCSIPAGWCEIHHVDEHSRGGETHTDNGVLLCWNHHHNLERSGWAIRMRDGVPLVKAPGWVDRRQIYRPIRTKRTEREKVRRRTAAAPPPRSVTAPLL
ncbi:MAG: DUF222 domain-containing protein [Microbacterium gubbeenense]